MTCNDFYSQNYTDPLTLNSLLHHSNNSLLGFPNSDSKKMAGVLAFYTVFRPRINLLKLRLCNAFVVKTRGGVMLPERVELRNRRREIFGVEVVKEGGEVYFSGGWGDFVEGNGLRSGYVLIFRYDGVRTFDVKIFDNFCCEVEFQDDEDDDDEVYYDETGTFGDPQEDKDEDDDFEEEESEDEDYEEEGSEDSSDADNGNPDPRVPNSSRRGPGRRGQARQKRPYYKHDWEDSDAEVLVKPKSLYFVAEKGQHKRKNQVQMTRFIVRDFSVELADKIIYRDPLGRKYNGKVSRWKTGQIWISAWGKFCKDNRIRDTDKCIFELELDEAQKCSSMLVHIIRKS